MKPVEFVVFGTPVPQGSKSATVRGGRAVMYNATAGIPAWRTAITQVASDLGHAGLRLDGPLHVHLHFFLPRPKSHFRANGVLRDDAPYWHTSKPDADKLTRAIYDALTVAGVIADDRLIASGTQLKSYTSGSPGVQIAIDTLTPTPKKEQ